MNDLISSVSDTATGVAAEGKAGLPEHIVEQLCSSALKRQLQLIDTVAEAGQSAVLVTFLKQRSEANSGANSGAATPAEGYALQMLAQRPNVDGDLKALTEALVSMPSDRSIDYGPLRQSLIAQEFQAADRFTLEKLCELAGAAAVDRKWLYFSEVNQFPVADLTTIDNLWRIFSQDKFGFSVQRDLWLGLGQNWDRLWPKIGWRSETWTRYPGEFTWSLSAPRGHLPLSNQLRGVRVMAALMNHPAWNSP
ncbi:MAG: GUN4 domain-containing protein [Elainellaceae cyanobacterium]